MTSSITSPMKKRGIVDPISIAVFVIVVLSISGATYILTTEDKTDFSNYYVGNSETKLVYDYKCVGNVKEESRIFFRTLDVAKSYNYTYVGC